MRLWSLHPQYLDRQGLLAVWREGLLAQAVLSGKTIGYIHHPQLTRFRMQSDPIAVIGRYLTELVVEAQIRGYHFDNTKILNPFFQETLSVTSGQIDHEWHHLLLKIKIRTPTLFEQYQAIDIPLPHPLFSIITGTIEPWEKIRTHDHTLL